MLSRGGRSNPLLLICLADREEVLERADRYGGSDAEKICHGKISFRLC